jgi:hypothetical protein
MQVSVAVLAWWMSDSAGEGGDVYLHGGRAASEVQREDFGGRGAREEMAVRLCKLSVVCIEASCS